VTEPELLDPSRVGEVASRNGVLGAGMFVIGHMPKPGHSILTLFDLADGRSRTYEFPVGFLAKPIYVSPTEVGVVGEPRGGYDEQVSLFRIELASIPHDK
jgi:hypothetical protein